jgi:hypothetical protein
VNQGVRSIAIGDEAGVYNQGGYTVAIGDNAGYTGQGVNAIAIGPSSGFIGQGQNTIALGFNSGKNEQADNAIAIGQNAGIYNQGGYAVAIGDNAGYTGQGVNAIAIGTNSGFTRQGQNGVAIGYLAGETNQPTNSIVINASGLALNGATGNSLYINPVRAYTGDAGATGTLVYNTSTKEITYNTAKTFVIDHPVNNEKYLVHSCLEGPEAGIYYRGKSCIEDEFDSVDVKLPEYIKNFGIDFTINITPIFTKEHKVRALCCTEVENGSFTVHGLPGPFFWTVFGKRFDIDAEPLKKDVDIKGDGPYKYI